MRRTMRDILVGLTFLLGMAGVATLLVLFGELSFGQLPTYPCVLQLDQASGLTTASRVTLNGVVVGKITSIAVSPDPRDGAVLSLSINQGVRIPRDSEIVLEQGLVGEATLLFRAVAADVGKDAGFIAPNETMRAHAMGVMEDLANSIEKRLGAFRGAAENFATLTRTFTEVGERARDMLTPRSSDPLNPAGAGAHPPANIPELITQLHAAAADARKWLGDDAMRGDAQAVFARFRETADRSAVAMEEWTRTARTLSSQADKLGANTADALAEFRVTTRNLNEILGEVQAIASRINRGEGTAGMFTNNPDLYRSLNDAAIRLEKTLTEAQLLIEKFRKEGVPIQF